MIPISFQPTCYHGKSPSHALLRRGLDDARVWQVSCGKTPYAFRDDWQSARDNEQMLVPAPETMSLKDGFHLDKRVCKKGC